jgi:hypothetical protein
MLALPQVAGDPAAALRATAHLPAAEAGPVLRAAVASPDPAERQDGYRLLFENAGREGDARDVVELLTRSVRVRNERDEVRAVVLRAAAALPIPLLTVQALPALDRLVRDALDARDTSPQTVSAAARLVYRVLWASAGRPEGAPLARWALGTAELMGGRDAHGLVPDPNALGRLRRGQGRLLALLAAWRRADQHRDVRIALVTSLASSMADPRVRSVLEQAATDEDRNLASAVVATSWRQLPPSARPGYAQLVGLVARHPDPRAAARALPVLGGLFRWAPGAGPELLRQVLELDRIDVWRGAVDCVGDPAVWTVDPGLPARLATALIERSGSGDDAGGTRDRPALRRIEYLVDRVCSFAEGIRRTPQPALLLSSVLSEQDELVFAAARIRMVLSAPSGVSEPQLEAVADLLQGGRPVPGS